MGRGASTASLEKSLIRALEEIIMPARTKRRAKFDFRGRPFVWWIDGDRYLRVLSLDKKFVIAVPFVWIENERLPVMIIGPEFPGVDRRERRPVVVVGPQPPIPTSMGAWVDCLLRWAFDPAHELLRVQEPIRFP